MNSIRALEAIAKLHTASRKVPLANVNSCSLRTHRMRRDEPGSLLETGTAVSLQTAPALLGTALLKIPSFLPPFIFALSLL